MDRYQRRPNREMEKQREDWEARRGASTPRKMSSVCRGRNGDGMSCCGKRWEWVLPVGIKPYTYDRCHECASKLWHRESMALRA